MAGSNVPGRLKSVIVGAARQYGIRPGDLAGLLDVESNFSSHSSSSAGAVGIAQFLPSTARSMGVNPYNDRSAIYGAAKYLRSLGYSKDRLRALGAYNGGPGNPQYGYARQVVSRGSQLAGQLAGAQGAPSGGGQGQPGTPGTPGTTRITKTVTPGVDNSGLRNQLKFQYLSQAPASPFSQKNLAPGKLPDLSKGVPSLTAQSSAPDPMKYLGQANARSNSLLSLAGQLSQAQDIPGSVQTNVQRTPGTPASGGGGGGGLPAGKYAFPVNRNARFSEERVDRGQDFSTNPGGHVYAIGSGTVTTNAGNFPGADVVIKLDHPYRDAHGHVWRYVFYGHSRRALVRPGQRVKAGQPVAVAGGVGGGGAGHMEVGFALDSQGSIIQNVGSDHYAASGQAIHDLLYGHSSQPGRVGRHAIREG